jgi:intracellular sulfur oxidation DsrE/DsrF family protein
VKQANRPASSNNKLRFSFLLFIFALLTVTLSFANPVANHGVSKEEFPELAEIRGMVETGQPDGVVFLVMDHDIEAYYWVLPRLERYVRMLREAWPQLPLAVLSHGDEIFSLLARNESEYPSFHQRLRDLVSTYELDVQVCGAYASMSGVDETEFADFVDVVPSAPSQVTDYRHMGYQVVNLEPMW